MPLHPVIAAAVLAGSRMPTYDALPIEQARAQARMAYPPIASPVPVGAVRDVFIPPAPGSDTSIPLRIYAPTGPGPHPVLVFFHGSGFVVLDLDTHDDLCRRLCAGADCVVASVDYRLAPENKFPAAPDDCLAATRWMAANAAEFAGDASRMAVAGDSAGGCLAAVTALRIRDEGGPALRGQLLFYPVTDHPSTPRASFLTFADGYGLTAHAMEWFWTQYLRQPADAQNAHASPLRAQTLERLPAACVLMAEYDVLLDEGTDFARRLSAAGVPTLERTYTGMNHGFLKYAGVLPQAQAAVDDACEWLRGILHRAPGG